MKKLYLICNSHLDPVWMWDWEEGLGEAVSTFYQAAQFCKEYDYIFNHNEAILYEFIEEKDPALFAKIQELVANGKWHIMGGWYLQPDCNLPSGEAFVRQIKLGREYFQKKFQMRPTTAINFDSFGHSVGLVQILKKCGYDSYLFCRPMPEMLTLPAREFLWEGVDGSTVKASRIEDESIYCSGYGTALTDIKRKASVYEHTDVGAALWGVGNHGGLPSRKDLNDVQEYIAQSDISVQHSTPEAYFSDLEPTTVYKDSLQPCLVGGYTSMQSIKQKHIELEHKLFAAEKLCSLAALCGLYKKNEESFLKAEKMLASIEFHDIGSGTCAADGEKSSLRKADYALELLQEEFNKAFFALCAQYPQAEQGEFPIFIFHPQPYEKTAVCETEFLMPKALISDSSQYTITAYQDGKPLPTQCIKELSNINYDRRKRIAYRCKLNPLGISKISFRAEITPKAYSGFPSFDEAPSSDILFSDSFKTLRISRKTGLLESYCVNGKELLKGVAFAPVIYEDNADPWGWYMDRIGKNPVPMQLSDCQNGPFQGLSNVRIIEDGEVLTEVESFFEGSASYVRISYKMYKNMPYTDITADVFWNEQQKALKLEIPTTLDGSFIGQVPFGTSELKKNGHEMHAQRFAGITDNELVFTLYNRCTCGFSAENDTLYATLLRGAAYCAHPIEDRPLVDTKRFIPYIEQGRHTFSFRLSYDERSSLENHAQEFTQPLYSLNFFPHGEEKIIPTHTLVLDPALSLSAFYQTKEGYILRILNNNPKPYTGKLTLCGIKENLSFGKYEAKTFLYDGTKLVEKELWV